MRAGCIDIGSNTTRLLVAERGAGQPIAVVNERALIALDAGGAVEAEPLRSCVALDGDPPAPAQLTTARSLVAEARTAASGGCGPPPAVRRALTVGGGSTALGRILCGTPAEPDGLADALRTLTAVPAAEVAAHHGIEPERARRLPATALLLGALLARLRVSAEPAGGGLREGVIAELLGR